MNLMDIIDDLIYIYINGNIDRIDRRELYKNVKRELSKMKKRDQFYFALNMKSKTENNYYLRKLNRYLDKILDRYYNEPNINNISKIKIYNDYLHKVKVNDKWIVVNSSYVIDLFEGREDELVNFIGVDGMINLLGNYI